jgi:hypothetical protein
MVRCSLQVETWASQQITRFSAGDYGGSVVAADDLLKAFNEEYLPALKRHKQVRQRCVAHAGCYAAGVMLCRLRRCSSRVPGASSALCRWCS